MVRDWQTSIDQLSRRVTGHGSRLDDMERVTARLNEVTAIYTNGIPPLRDRLSRLEDRVDDLAGEISDMQQRLLATTTGSHGIV